MKPILIAFVLFASTVTKSFAADVPAVKPAVDPTVLKAFNATFTNATEVDWSITQDFFRAVFVLNGQYITAYYKIDGTMAALTRHISTHALPVILQTSLKNNYKGQWVSDVLEVTNEEGLQYYATVENAEGKIILKSSSTNWSTFQKQRNN